jgi:diguanylate cyclase (GGDEF)-like protein/PAS domain S-box-containing protein
MKNQSDYLKIFTEHIPGVLMINDLLGNCIYVTPNCEKLLGYSPKEFIQLNFHDIIHPEDLYKINDVQQKIHNMAIGIPITIRFRIQHKNKHYICLETMICKLLVNVELGEQVFWYNRDITDKRVIETELENSQKQFEIMFNHSAIGIALVNTDGNPIKCNNALVDFLGYSEELLCSMNFEKFTHPEDIKIDSHLFDECMAGVRNYYQIEKRYIKKDRSITWGRLTVSVVRSKGKYIQYVVAMVEDISQQKKMEKSLESERLKYKSLVEDALVGVYTIQEGNLVYVNPRLEEITGYTSEELYNKDFITLFHRDHQEEVSLNMKKRLNFEDIEPSAVYKLVRKDKSVITIEVNAHVSTIEGIPTLTGSVMDITARQEAEEKVNKLAYYDVITQLPNRYRLEESFVNYMRPGLKFALLFISLDRFNVINNTKGHRFGELLIERVAEKLKRNVKDGSFLARFGEAEFIILQPFKSILEVANFAQSILDDFSDSMLINNHEIFQSVSIGISVYESDGYDFETLVKHADLAMNDALEQGGNKFQFYTSLINDKVSRKVNLEFAIRKAIENNEFILFYQPKYNLITKEIIGVEALLRWNHPNYGMISPTEFIPIAEETGLIIPLGAWALEEACRQFKKIDNKNISLAVNISARQIQQGGFFKRVRDILFKTGLNPNLLELELTESIMQNHENTFDTLQQLRSLGIKLSIDDFGTGYSSLSILKDLPVHIIKIDRSFINNLLGNFKTNALVRAIIDLGQNLNYEIVAEGIEEEEQAELLKLYKCQTGQGFYFSKPIPFSEMEVLIRDQIIN